MKIVAVSGGWDPIHIGHIRLFFEAKKLVGPKGMLIVILNNDNWLKAKKGKVFMPQQERAAILHAIKGVGSVYTTTHEPNPEDMSVCQALTDLKPDIFANGGDRKEDNIPEYQLCEELGIEMVFGIGGEKIQSSSWLTEGKDNG